MSPRVVAVAPCRRGRPASSGRPGVVRSHVPSPRVVSVTTICDKRAPIPSDRRLTDAEATGSRVVRLDRRQRDSISLQNTGLRCPLLEIVARGTTRCCKVDQRWDDWRLSGRHDAARRTGGGTTRCCRDDCRVSGTRGGTEGECRSPPGGTAPMTAYVTNRAWRLACRIHASRLACRIHASRVAHPSRPGSPRVATWTSGMIHL